MVETRRIHKKKKMTEKEEELGCLLEDYIPEKYDELGNLYLVADDIGISRPTLSIWLLRMGLTNKKLVRE